MPETRVHAHMIKGHKMSFVCTYNRMQQITMSFLSISKAFQNLSLIFLNLQGVKYPQRLCRKHKRKIDNQNLHIKGSICCLIFSKKTEHIEPLLLVVFFLNCKHHIHGHLLVLPGLCMQIQALHCFTVNAAYAAPSHSPRLPLL